MSCSCGNHSSTKKRLAVDKRQHSEDNIHLLRVTTIQSEVRGKKTETIITAEGIEGFFMLACYSCVLSYFIVLQDTIRYELNDILRGEVAIATGVYFYIMFRRGYEKL
jgi:hypothetical protein